MIELRTPIGDDLVEAVAQRAAEIVLERMGGESNGHDAPPALPPESLASAADAARGTEKSA